MGASLDNIQKCECSNGCPNKVVEYKCPWKHRDLHQKEAFLTPEISGIRNGNEFALKPSSKYYFQLQLEMFVSELILNVLVVWTRKGIFTVEVPYNPSFMSNVCFKLEKYWISQVLPFMMIEVSKTVFPAPQTCKLSRIPSITFLVSVNRSHPASSEVDTSTFQDTSCPKQSDIHDIVDLLDPQYSSSPTTLPDSVVLSGLQIYKADLQTVQPKEMITDTKDLFFVKSSGGSVRQALNDISAHPNTLTKVWVDTFQSGSKQAIPSNSCKPKQHLQLQLPKATSGKIKSPKEITKQLASKAEKSVLSVNLLAKKQRKAILLKPETSANSVVLHCVKWGALTLITVKTLVFLFLL
ncbi:hypothetical protein ACROYT_G015041 [Oculina patagonica]